MTDSSSSSSGLAQLDVPYDKLVEWCVSRGQLSPDWLLQLKAVQAKVKQSVADPQIAIPVQVQRHMEERGQPQSQSHVAHRDWIGCTHRRAFSTVCSLCRFAQV
jgi:hypothetical protein